MEDLINTDLVNLEDKDNKEEEKLKEEIIKKKEEEKLKQKEEKLKEKEEKKNIFKIFSKIRNNKLKLNLNIKFKYLMLTNTHLKHPITNFNILQSYFTECKDINDLNEEFIKELIQKENTLSFENKINIKLKKIYGNIFENYVEVNDISLIGYILLRNYNIKSCIEKILYLLNKTNIRYIAKDKNNIELVNFNTIILLSKILRINSSNVYKKINDVENPKIINNLSIIFDKLKNIINFDLSYNDIKYSAYINNVIYKIIITNIMINKYEITYLKTNKEFYNFLESKFPKLIPELDKLNLN
jgi:hypothetical protein